MNNSFWKSLPRPIIGLSPMDGVTDHPFRHITKKYSNPDLIYTEFTNVEGLCHGAEKLLNEFIFDETQRPVIAQIYGKTPRFFRQVAVLACELGFDGIDINMGCPSKNVTSHGSGAGLIRTPKLAQDIIKATQQGVRDWAEGKKSRDCQDIEEIIWKKVEALNKLLPKKYQELREIPVSVKTRVGFDSKIVDQWIPTLLEMNLPAIAIHGRTLQQGYSGLADWEEIGKAVDLAKNTDTLILGNGDIDSLVNAKKKIKTYGVDGVLIGRAAFGDPVVFDPAKNDSSSVTQKAEIALEHARLYEKTFSHHPKYRFLPMRKHLGWYIKDFPDAKKVRVELMQTQSSQEVEKVLNKYKLLSI